MKIEEVFIGRARKYNSYQEGEHIDNQSCHTCIRKHFSYPYTCNDGWAMGESEWTDRGNKCINWSDDSKCQVD